MKQAEFDAKIDGLVGKVEALDAKSDAEAAQVASLTQNYKAEIERLREQHPDLDTSRLDELNNKLDQTAQRIGDIVPDAEKSNDDTDADKAQPMETVDPLEPATAGVPATNVETETTVTTRTEGAATEAAEATDVSATATADTASGEVSAEAEVTGDANDEGK